MNAYSVADAVLNTLQVLNPMREAALSFHFTDGETKVLGVLSNLLKVIQIGQDSCLNLPSVPVPGIQ